MKRFLEVLFSTLYAQLLNYIYNIHNKQIPDVINSVCGESSEIKNKRKQTPDSMYYQGQTSEH